jgi:hypothetical protein
MLLIALVAACGPSTGPSASPSTAASPSPSLPPATEADLAYDVASRFEEARAAGQWDEAWALLAPSTQASIGLVEQFALDQTAYNDKGGTAFVITEPSRDPGLAEQLLGPRRDEVATEADLGRGYLVFITHPAIPGSEGTRAYLAAPLLVGGEWRLWLLA